MMANRTSRALLLLIGLTPALLSGQERIKREDVRFTGTLKGVRGNLLHVLGEDGDERLVKLPSDKQKITYENQADVSWLRAGLLVQFSTRLDRKLKAYDAVDSLSVISVRPTYKLGIVSEGGIAGDLFLESNDDSKKKKKKTASDAEPRLCQVTAVIAAVKKNKVLLITDNAKLEVDLTDDAKIQLDVFEVTWAREGDSVAVNGWALSGQKQNVVANQVVVTGKRKLSLEKSDEEEKDRDTKDREKNDRNKNDKKNNKEKRDKEAPKGNRDGKGRDSNRSKPKST